MIFYHFSLAFTIVRTMKDGIWTILLPYGNNRNNTENQFKIVSLILFLITHTLCSLCFVGTLASQMMIKNTFHFITIDLFTEPIRAGMQKKSASKWNLFFLNCTHYSIAFKSLHMSWYGFVCEREFFIQRCTSLSIPCLRNRWSLF